MNFKIDILPFLPYDKPFLFVDNIVNVENGMITGEYTFKKEAEFYNGHFKNKPITPGVLLTECAAQISLACYGIYKLKDKSQKTDIAMSSSQMEFIKVCYPDEKITVIGEEIYYRFNKLKMAVKIYKGNAILVAKGELAGMVINFKTSIE
jgi:3-hydroxyacyl-[acyl-carrier-protein] dehydratase